MALKINVGLCKKIGQRDYGSLGASCSVEIELGGAMDGHDLDEVFQERARRAYLACRKAVEEELAASRDGSLPGSVGDTAASSRPANARSNGRHGLPASEKQLDYIRQLAGQIRGLGARRLEALSKKMFAKAVADLASLEASGLIDALKDIKDGKIDLTAALGGTAT
jgi:hypothetical protein